MRVAFALVFLALRKHRSLWDRLRHELRGVFPVYSAQTTRGGEAEFIRDRLPRPLRFRLWTTLLATAAAVLAWWLTR